MNTTTIDERVARAVAHMQRNLDKFLWLPGLAARVQLSPSHFRYLFSLETGMGPAQYLQRLRLRRARLLIERTFLSVELVMDLVGYDDAGLFERDFQRLHGITPGALRETRAAAPLRVPRPDASALGEIPGADPQPDRAERRPRTLSVQRGSQGQRGGPYILRHR